MHGRRRRKGQHWRQFDLGSATGGEGGGGRGDRGLDRSWRPTRGGWCAAAGTRRYGCACRRLPPSTPRLPRQPRRHAPGSPPRPRPAVAPPPRRRAPASPRPLRLGATRPHCHFFPPAPLHSGLAGAHPACRRSPAPPPRPRPNLRVRRRRSWCRNLLFPFTKKMKRHVSGFKKLRCGGPGMPVPCGAEFVAPQTRRHKLKRVSDRG